MAQELPFPCLACGLYARGCHSPWIQGTGPNGADVLVIGDYPGYDEDIQGRPWVGPAGRLLRARLAAAGISDDRVFFTNVLRCRVPHGAQPRPEELKACSGFLDREVAAVKPRTILVMGEHAVKAVLGLTLRKARTEVHLRWGRWTVASYNPAAALKDPIYLSAIDKDLVRLARAVRGDLVRAQTVNHRLADTPDAVATALAELRHAPVVAFDLETSPLHPYGRGGAAILCFALSGSPGTATVIPWGHPGAALDGTAAEAIRPMLQEFFADPSIPKVAQNAKFDLMWLFHNGFEVNGLVGDTLLAHYLTDEVSSHGLASLTWDYTDIGPYWWGLDAAIEEAGGDLDYANIKWEALWPYAGYDADATLRAWLNLEPLVAAEGCLDLHRALHVPVSSVFARIQLAGIEYDIEAAEVAVKKIEVIERGIMAKIRSLPTVRKYETVLAEQGVKPDADGFRFDPNSPKALGKFLFEYLKLDAGGYRRPGETPSTDADALLTLAPALPLTRHILDLRKAGKYRSTYFAPAASWVGVDGLVHSDFLIFGTRTGRISAKEPNVLNIPREGDERATELGIPSPKSLWVSRFPDGMIGECDLSQIEVRILASFSGDADLIRLFYQGGDVHRLVASELWGIPPEQVSPELRFRAKGVVFAMAYGGGPETVVKNVGCTFAEAQDTFDRFFQRFQQLRAWITAKQREVCEVGYVRTATGQKRRLVTALGRYYSASDDPRVAEALRQAINSPVQGTASHVCLTALCVLDRLFREHALLSRIISHVYDSIIFDIHPRELRVVPTLAVSVMTGLKFPWLCVPLEANFKMGRTWAEVATVEPETQALVA